MDPACWKLLNCTQYLRNWMATNGSATCGKDVPFATCFQRTLNIVSQDCTGIKDGTCAPPSNDYTPEQYYILYNIYGRFAAGGDMILC